MLIALENILLFAPSRVCFSKARANAPQKVVLGLLSSTCGALQESYGHNDTIEPTFIASSRNTICEIGSFFDFKTFSKVYT